MPPCRMPHIVSRWIEIGMVEGGGMAPVALRWSELTAWQAGTGVTLGTWELRTIHAMSVAYIAEGRRAEEETCPPPWKPPVTISERQTEEARLRMLLG
ncbi:phage tail assembly chaperone [Sphingomonas panni]